MRKNRIYIEALALVDKHFSGVGQYILGLLRGLDDLLEENRLNGTNVPEVYALIPYDKIEIFDSFEFKNIKARKIPINNRYTGALWHRGLLFPIDLLFGKGYYVFTRFVGMPLLKNKSAVIIYDLSFVLHPEYSEDKNADFLSKQVPRSLKKVNKVITISNNAKNEINEYYKVPKKDIEVIYPAADLSLFKRKTNIEIKAAKNRHGIKGKYIMALSNLEPRKNLKSLILGYCKLDKDELKDVALVIVGVKGWKSDSLIKLIKEKIEEGYNIIWPDEYVNDSDKVALFSGALALVYPSHYEGFGMPPLEALACGTPVIVSNNSSLPEVVGNQGILLKSNDPDGIKDAIHSLIKDPKDLTVTGPKHAQKFSWRAGAEKLIDLTS